MITQEDIKRWLFNPGYKEMSVEEIKKKYSHMLVVCDTFDYVDYPVHIERGENIHDKMRQYSENMQKIMEIYNYDLDLDEQLSEGMGWNI